jgi:lysine 2,3-aminomutase
MINDIVGPKAGLQRLKAGPSRAIPRTISLSVLSDMEDGSDDEPPGQAPLVTSHATTSSNGNSHSNGRSRAARTNGRANVISSNGNGHSAHAHAHTATAAPSSADFVMSQRTSDFRARCFPDVADDQWNDWKWQLRMRVRDAETLAGVLNLTSDELATVNQLGGQLPVGITPYYASLLDPDSALQGLRKTLVPTSHEFVHLPAEAEDPLAEDADSPVPGLVHRYPDRVLFLVTSFCAVYCRYCTRSRLVGKTGEYHFNLKQFQQAIDYIAAHPEIRDVLISGGDPLTMNDDKIEWLLSRLRAIPHVEFIRIGTKVPVVLPQRITPALCAMLKKYHPFWMSVHFMHPDEVTPEVAQACGRLADAGIPLGSQTVLTAGVNDDVETMKRLMHGLLKIRVRPYYIYQCDPIPGSSHFRTPIEKGLEIIEGLRGHTTGYAVPQFVIDAPGGGGKIPILPNYLIGRDGDDVLLRNYEGKIFRYPDPVAR